MRSQDEGFYYAPDPSSQIACTIGGNVAENSGGVHCLKYGLTTNNVLGLEMVLIDGDDRAPRRQASRCRRLRSARADDRLRGPARRRHRGDRAHPAQAGDGAGAADRASPATRRRAIASPPSSRAGIIPGGMEMMDRPAIHAAEDFVQAGYPLDVEALLIVELDGPAAEVDHLIAARCEAIAKASGAVSIRVSQAEEERLKFWAGRKAAFPAVGRISPDYYCMDGTIPRGRLPQVLPRMSELSKHYGLRVANVFHAGDGNLHPLILYDANKPGELERAEAFGADILRLCVEVGGVLTGEHGVGVEKRDLMPHDVQRGRPGAAAAREMRLRSRRPAQSRQGLPRTAPLRRAGPHACAAAASCRSPTCRGSELAASLLQPTQPRTSSRSSSPCGGRRRARRSRSSARGTKRGLRPAGRGRRARSTCRGLRGIVAYEPDELVLTARAGTPLAEIEAAARGEEPACSPSSRGDLRAALWRSGGAGHDRRRARLQSRGPAAAQGRRGARSLPRLQRRQRPGRDLQGRRQGGEERHRLRPAEAARGSYGTLAVHGRGDAEGAARAGEVPHRAAVRAGRAIAPSPRCRRRSTAPMRSRAPPICRPASPHAPASISSPARHGRHRDPHRRPWPLGRPSLRGAAPRTRRRHRDRRAATPCARRCSGAQSATSRPCCPIRAPSSGASRCRPPPARRCPDIATDSLASEARGRG